MKTITDVQKLVYESPHSCKVKLKYAGIAKSTDIILALAQPVRPGRQSSEWSAITMHQKSKLSVAQVY